MDALEIGRICIKTNGRDAGSIAAIVDVEKDFVILEGPNARRRKCNPKHLLFTEKKIKISKGASKDEVKKKLMEINR